MIECYLYELNEKFSKEAVFFYDVYGGSQIGVMFQPAVKEKKKGPLKKFEESLESKVDMMAELGTGLVTRVEMKE